MPLPVKFLIVPPLANDTLLTPGPSQRPLAYFEAPSRASVDSPVVLAALVILRPASGVTLPTAPLNNKAPSPAITSSG